MITSFSNNRFTISFPGPTIQIKGGGTMGLSIHELRELGDLIQVSLETTGNGKREFKPWDKGGPYDNQDDPSAHRA